MRKDIEIIYKQYKNNIAPFECFSFNDNSNRNYYVYEWFLPDGKVFYVGKGTGKRYNHIIVEIEKNIKHCYYYKRLQEDFGINYRIVKNELTEEEALFFERYWIWKREKEGEVLIQFIDAHSFWGDIDEYRNLILKGITPPIWVEPFERRYYNKKPGDYLYDNIEIERLKHSFILRKNDRQRVNELLKVESILKKYDCRVYCTLCKGVKCIIDMDSTSLSEYEKYKKRGLSVYNANQLIDFGKNIQ